MNNNKKNTATTAFISSVLILWAAAASASTVTFNQVLAQQNSIEISADNGRLEVEKSSEKKLEIEIKLIGSACKKFENPAVLNQESGRLMHLMLNHDMGDQCDAHWQVKMPKRVALKAAFARADMLVNDLKGGLDLKLGKGDIQIDVTGGPLHIEVTNGDIKVKYRANQTGALNLDTTVGDLDVQLNGRNLDVTKPPGAGNHFRMSGEGGDDIELSAVVGDIKFESESDL
ncbi:MAG: DUF4097 family beta strand repeat-containing protein [Marinicella sp.]